MNRVPVSAHRIPKQGIKIPPYSWGDAWGFYTKDLAGYFLRNDM